MTDTTPRQRLDAAAERYRTTKGAERDAAWQDRQAALHEIVAEHARWVRRESGSTRANLSRAYLARANLAGADLARANLVGANLARANLVGADLVGANLARANLVGADLADADLVGADLADADLADANLADADLARANLVGADLVGANLARADLVGADLADADLADANLADADLADADLVGANLARANLAPIWEDIDSILAAARAEVPALISALREGRVDGSVYAGPCACLIGTLANARGCIYTQLEGVKPNPGRAAERWFAAIRRGDTPATNPVSALTVEHVEQWFAAQVGAR